MPRKTRSQTKQEQQNQKGSSVQQTKQQSQQKKLKKSKVSKEKDRSVSVEEQKKKQNDNKKKKKPEKPQKKPVKKSVEEQSRIYRSKHDRIFLLSAERNQAEDYWHFVVQGTKGSHYNLNLSTEVHCTCTDFRIRRVPCKHIYFIVTQVGQNQQLLDYFKNDKKITKKAYKILDEQLSNRLKNRMTKKDPKQIDLKGDKDCVICFSQMQKETEPLQDCPTCKKYFHSQCIEAWKNHNITCPLCRGPLSGDKTGRDPLGKLIDIKL